MVAARFVGYRHGEDLAAHLAAADVFVFPSRTDTFGLVLLEALELGGEGCIAYARRYSWRRSAEAFATLIAPAGPSAISTSFG